MTSRETPVGSTQESRNGFSAASESCERRAGAGVKTTTPLLDFERSGSRGVVDDRHIAESDHRRPPEGSPEISRSGCDAAETAGPVARSGSGAPESPSEKR